MAKLKDISKAQVLYDALMIVTDGKKYQIRDLCDTLTNTGNLTICNICNEINVHLIEQGY
jgi:hypothetical protein